MELQLPADDSTLNGIGNHSSETSRGWSDDFSRYDLYRLSLMLRVPSPTDPLDQGYPSPDTSPRLRAAQE